MKAKFFYTIFFYFILITSCNANMSDSIIIKAGYAEEYNITFNYDERGYIFNINIATKHDRPYSLTNYNRYNNITISYDKDKPNRIMFIDKNDEIYKDITITRNKADECIFRITSNNREKTVKVEEQQIIDNFIYSAGRTEDINIGNLWYEPHNNIFLFEIRADAYKVRSGKDSGQTLNHLVETKFRDDGNVFDIHFGIDRTKPYISIIDVKKNLGNIFNVLFKVPQLIQDRDIKRIIPTGR